MMQAHKLCGPEIVLESRKALSSAHLHERIARAPRRQGDSQKSRVFLDASRMAHISCKARTL
jgi:hypothetical protein